MNRRQQAIARIRSLLVPPTQFTSCTTIFDPKAKADDPQATTKREIIGFAARTADAFESGSLHTRAELTALEAQIDEYRTYFESGDEETQEYLQLLSAVEELIASDTDRAAESV